MKSFSLVTSVRLTWETIFAELFSHKMIHCIYILAPQTFIHDNKVLSAKVKLEIYPRINCYGYSPYIYTR